MKANFQTALVFALLGSTALAPAAVAQSNTAAGQECTALDTLIDDNRDQLRGEWIDSANGAISAGNAAQCDDLHEQATAALDQNERMQRGEDNLDSDASRQAAQIIVTQPDPDVTIEQEAPQVSVNQAQPSVTVDQGQPEILVRQKSPNVSVQIAQPVITIDQPQPEIIIRMPDPRVAVTSPQPEIEVRQGEPTVTVEQAEPRVSVVGDEQSDGSNVNVQQGEPNVDLQTAEGQPQVDVQRQEPRVSFEAAEPNIDVQMQGEPEIRFSQTGEPTVRFEEAGDAQQTAQADRTRDVEQNQLADAGPELDEQGNQRTADANMAAQSADEDLETGSIQQDEAQTRQQDQTSVLALIMSDGSQTMPDGQLQEYPASELIGETLVNSDDRRLGTVQMLVEAGGTEYVVLGADSALGDGQRGVVLPLDNVQLVDDQLILRGLTDEEYAELRQYDRQNAERIAEDATIEVATR